MKKQNCEKTCKKLEELNVNCAFNSLDYNYDKLKFIVVGDNPGKIEYKSNEYFKGSAGIKLKEFLKVKKLIKDFDTECILFNKPCNLTFFLTG